MQPSDRPQSSGAAVFKPISARLDLSLYHYRSEEFGRYQPLSAEEARRRYADDRESAPVEQNIFADDRGVAAEAPLPATVTQYDDRMRAGSLVIRFGQCPPHRRANAERVEVISRNKIAPEVFVPSTDAAAQIRRRETKGDKAGEDLVPVAHVTVIRIRQPVALLLADVITDKPLQRRAGQGPKQIRVCIIPPRSLHVSLRRP